MLARGRRREQRGHGPRWQRGRLNFLRWARRGSLVNGGMKTVRDPLNSENTVNNTEEGKVKVFRKGLSKKQLTAELVKLKQSGVRVYNFREVSCSRQREIR